MLLKKGGSKLSRTETVTVRLDPKLRYLAELASRKQRRTLSSFIEWAIEDCLKRESIGHDPYQNELSFFEVTESLWDIDEKDRLLKLASDYPQLLNHDEQVLWKLIKEFNVPDFPSSIRFYDNKTINHQLISDCWLELKGLAEGTVTEQELQEAMRKNNIPF